ncbi:hypothetical protein RSA5_03105, partial [Rothia kristinae]
VEPAHRRGQVVAGTVRVRAHGGGKFAFARRGPAGPIQQLGIDDGRILDAGDPDGRVLGGSPLGIGAGGLGKAGRGHETTLDTVTIV